ncbi:tetratricopeptide repeat protein [Kordia jejudonensis]|uniref:tetratricopeptide repeat protein n=1 Tax=Kordia jejudonensis TaxID=1348245 RepID=UPI0006297000|nr:tetratricopeptide repeat protein [Kordia jejudonensis]
MNIYRILRITIGIVMLFSLCQCTQKTTSEHQQSSNKTSEQLLALIKEYKKTDLPKALAFSDELIFSARKAKDTFQLLEGYLQKGVVMTHLGDYDKAIDLLKRQLPLLEKDSYTEMKCRYNIGIGNAYVLTWKNSEALDFYQKANKIATTHGYGNWKCIAQVNTAKVMRNIGDKQEALNIYKEMYAQANDFEVSEANKLRIFMGIGGTLLTLNKPDSALYYSRKGLKISKELNDKMLESYFYHDIGIAYTQKKEYKEALKNLYKVTNYTKAIKNDERSAESLFYIGKCYYGLGKYELASEQFEQVIVIIDGSDEIKNSKFEPQELVDTYNLLAECYQKLKKDEKLIELVKSNQKKLSIEINDNNNKVKATLYKSQNKELADILKQKEKFQQKLLYIIFALLVAVLGCFFYYKKKAKRDKMKFEALIKLQKESEVQEKSTPKTNTNKIIINDAKVHEIIKRLKKLEEQEYYLEVSCSLSKMAKKAKTNGTYLTKILKEHEGKAFYEYINTLRINYTIKRLQADKQFRKYAIKHIAKEVGYKSPESFTKHFKKTTGINPSYYIKEIEKLQSANKL